MTVYKNLACAMLKRGIKPTELVKMICERGYSLSTSKFYRQMNGQNEISFKQAWIMSQILDERIDHLMEETCE